MTHQTFSPRKDVTLAYHKTEGASKTLPGVMFMGGFRSDMTGTKAQFLETQCKRRHQTFLRFDYSGHGASSGQFVSCTLTTWLRDAEAMFDQLTKGPQIIVGSSMGGWLAMLLAQSRVPRVKGLILLAPAPDFSEDIYNKEFGEEERRHLAKKGVIYRPSNYGDPYPLTLGLFNDARRHLLLERRSVYQCPVRIIHGKKDPDVPWRKSERILEQSSCPDAKIIWVEDGDHRLSRDQDLTLLDETLVELSQLQRLEGAKD